LRDEGSDSVGHAGNGKLLSPEFEDLGTIRNPVCEASGSQEHRVSSRKKMKMKVGDGLAKAQDINLPDSGKAQNCLNGQGLKPGQLLPFGVFQNSGVFHMPKRGYDQVAGQIDPGHVIQDDSGGPVDGQRRVRIRKTVAEATGRGHRSFVLKAFEGEIQGTSVP